MEKWTKIAHNLNNYTETVLIASSPNRHTKDILKGVHLRIGTVQNYPLSYAVLENGTWVGKGVTFDIIKYVQEKLGFTYTVYLPKDKTLDSDEGVVGMLKKNKVDVVAAFLHNEFFRSLGFPSSKVLDMEKWSVMMKRPKESATGSGLTAPFTWDVWLIILLFLSLIGPIMHYIIRCRGYLFNDHNEPSTYTKFKCSWFAYGALLKQGSTLDPKSDTTRILFATWWIFITILTAFYTANLTAFLTLSQFKLPINAPEDIGQKRYGWVTEKGDPIVDLIKDKSKPLYHALEGSKSRVVDKERQEILDEDVYLHNYLFISEKHTIQQLMYKSYLKNAREGIEEEHRCTFVMTDWEVVRLNRVFVYSKNFTYENVFNRQLLLLSEGGIITRKIKEGLPAIDICPLNLGSKERQLRNTDLLLTYYLVAGGYTLSVVILIAEVFSGPDRRKKHAMDEVKEEIDGKPMPELPPPPSYQALFGEPNKNGKLMVYNGREYWVVKGTGGRRKLIPARCPSAILYHYKF